MKLIRVAAAGLNQTPLDWEGNKRNICTAIDAAKKESVSFLCLPELCITGYGCEDAFLSVGLQEKALEVLHEIAVYSSGIAVSVGLPLRYGSSLYNCACLLVDGDILGFPAKHYLAGTGIHYEPRWFSPWPRGRRGQLLVGGRRCAIGDLVFDCGGVKAGFEICEDAWVSSRPGASLAREGTNIIFNPSASHFAFGKYEVRRRFVLEGSRAFGVVYLYANLLGNEAGRIIYDGGELIASAGEIASAGHRFSYRNFTLTTAVVDLDRNTPAHQYSAADFVAPADEEKVYYCLKHDFIYPELHPEPKKPVHASWERSSDLKAEEFSRAVALGLFDYLRKSRHFGFVVSLSGGADSSTCACLVYLMVKLGVADLGFEAFKKKLSYIPALENVTDEAGIMNAVLTCVYQATKNSSETTRNAAKSLAEAIGASFLDFTIDRAVDEYTSLVSRALDEELTWEKHDLALQNIQARARAPLVWLIANLKRALLLATSNRSEAAVGYTTMDGDTAGGLGPIAGIDKAFVRSWIAWLEEKGVGGKLSVPALAAVTAQAPTAELRPPEAGQTDEDDLMPYVILDVIERHAIRDKKMPIEVYRLVAVDFPQYAKEELLVWIETFFRLWARNQWKRERYAPSFHLDDENLDPKTWCRFPILSGGFEEELRKLRFFVLKEEKPAE